jgi:hypothetical protein
VKRRPWLTLVILVLVGISATMLVQARRGVRMSDDIVIAFDDGVAPCPAPLLDAPPVRVVTIDDALVPASPVRETRLITIAPKTSPPR